MNLLKERIVNRRTCKKCGEIYNLKTKPLAADGSCKKCGSTEIQHRKDDTEEVVANRLNVFKESNDPIIEFYKNKNCLIDLNAQQSEDQVFEDIKKIIDNF